jgi:hypothetical protein
LQGGDTCNVVTLLMVVLQGGADVNARTKLGVAKGWTALHRAVLHGFLPLVQVGRTRQGLFT